MLTFKTINTVAITLCVGLLIGDIYLGIPFLVYLILILCWLIITTIGSFNIAWNFHLKALNSNPNCKEKQIAITFDDGPNNIYTPQILKLLEQYKAKATFFCIGKQVEQHPNILKSIIAQGHTIGNHSYSHSSYFSFFGKEKVFQEIDKTNTVVELLISNKLKLFRPPYGITNPAIAKAIKLTKHHVIGWNIRSLDTVIKNKQKILNRITRKLSPGSVILLHDSQEMTVGILEQLLLFLQENGYQSVTIDTLFNIEAYA